VQSLTSKTARTEYFQDTGVQESHFALHPDVLSGFDATTMAPGDFMHDEAGGTTLFMRQVSVCVSGSERGYSPGPIWSADACF
jgi:hypothetical protein